VSRVVVGTFTPCIPCLTDGLPHALLAVLTFDEVTKTYVAYHGIVNAVPSGSPQATRNISAVAASGAKLTYEEAATRWPSLSRDTYQQF
jgi:hypothetical protein